ncbi:hypothetical protein [Auritidibacter ignavus]|nr:hypothetical protein [Auritidibacter ignavus]WGH89396.1 hypothetical protein QDX22_04755 [Auritidibacter ignavus]
MNQPRIEPELLWEERYGDPMVMKLDQELWQAQQDAWDEDPNVWQNPLEETPYLQSLVEMYHEETVDGEFPSVLDRALELPRFQDVTEEFKNYLKAIVISHKVQLRRERVRPFDLDEMERQSLKGQKRTMMQLDVLMHRAFEWMKSQGMDPMPGHETMPVVMNEQMYQRALQRQKEHQQASPSNRAGHTESESRRTLPKKPGADGS